MRRVLVIFSFLFLLSFQVSLTAQEKKDTVAVDKNAVPVLEITVVDNKLKVKNAPVGKHIEIRTILGSKIKEIEVKSPDAEYVLSLPKAMYIFKLDGTVRKFIIK